MGFGLLLQLIVPLLQSVQLHLELIDLCHILVLDAEVVHLDLDVADLSRQFVLLLLTTNNCVKDALQTLDLIVDLLDLLVLSVFEDGIFDFNINVSDLLYKRQGALADRFDLIEDTSDLFVLALQVFDQAIDAAKVLVPVHILGHRRPLLLHVLEDLLFMLDLLDRGLELLLQVLDLVLLVAVLNALVRNLLLRHDDLFVDGLLVLFPLFFQRLQLRVNLGHFFLEDAHILALEFFELLDDFLLFLDVLLVRLEVFSEFLLGLFEFLLLLLEAL